MNALSHVDIAISRLSVFDTVAECAPTVEQVAAWVNRLTESALHEFDTLVLIENDLTPKNEQDFVRSHAALLSASYEHWSHEVETLLKRIEQIERRGIRIAGSEALRDHLGRTLAMLDVTLDDIDEADEQFRRGQGMTIEEVRNELRATVRAEGAAGSGRTGSVASGGDIGRDRVAG